MGFLTEKEMVEAIAKAFDNDLGFTIAWFRKAAHAVFKAQQEKNK